jgi:C4-dicarboxylate-specific signal transduction histidine kinase
MHGFALLYIGAAHSLLRLKHPAATYLLLLFYVLFAAGIVWSLGVNTPIGTLILGLVIVLASILLKASHALCAAIIAGSILLGMQAAAVFNWFGLSGLKANDKSSFGEVFVDCAVFSVLAIVLWLYCRGTERSLICAKQREETLLQQKVALKTQNKRYTNQLRHLQLEEMQQMYRFAELGQNSIGLLHDLANNLTALTLEMENSQNNRQVTTTAPTQRLIGRLAEIVDDTKEKLRRGAHKQKFDIVRKTSEAIAYLQNRAAKAHVTIVWQPPARSWRCLGDPASLCQIIGIIINNAIDAYDNPKNRSELPNKNQVIITMQQDDTHNIIKISDWGKGISKAGRKHLFEPFHSTKTSGLGLGLYIAKHTAELQLSGTIELDPTTDHTEFVVKLPRVT